MARTITHKPSNAVKVNYSSILHDKVALLRPTAAAHGLFHIDFIILHFFRKFNTELTKNSYQIRH